MLAAAALAGVIASGGCVHYPTVIEAGGTMIRPDKGRAVRQGPGAVVYFELKSSGKYGDVITAVHTPVARQAQLVSGSGEPLTRVEVPGAAVMSFTPTGPHVVLEKDQTVHMTSASYGITNPKDPNYYAEDISLCLRISYSGEYCHAAGWNIPDHGVRNVSHGCVNMNPADAQWLYSTFTVGDVVEVKGTPVPLPVGDGLGDWAVPYGQYGS